jgi:hypothetical protein
MNGGCFPCILCNVGWFTCREDLERHVTKEHYNPVTIQYLDNKEAEWVRQYSNPTKVKRILLRT